MRWGSGTNVPMGVPADSKPLSNEPLAAGAVAGANSGAGASAGGAASAGGGAGPGLVAVSALLSGAIT